MQLIVTNSISIKTYLHIKMILTVPSSQALFGAFLFATSFFWALPELVLATSNSASVTRQYKFDVYIIIPFKSSQQN